ncbi:hypothetical protein BaRGS_00013434 [Batillaria attramentaria]|uniref:Uncharacterized protein n=1 Tax=Batillaria attramentaria TaxID=370345 RepID=A0ABD0L7W3_9CAEN
MIYVRQVRHRTWKHFVSYWITRAGNYQGCECVLVPFPHSGHIWLRVLPEYDTSARAWQIYAPGPKAAFTNWECVRLEMERVELDRVARLLEREAGRR